MDILDGTSLRTGESPLVDFRPIRAVRYAPEAGELSDLICPPYDVISEEQEHALLARSPYNMVRMELAELEGPPPPDRYDGAAEVYARLRHDGVLKRDAEPGYYLLRQRFARGSATVERYGLLGALRGEEPGTGVLPHEDTAAGPKEDRLALMQATQANFSPLLMLYRDPSGAVAKVIGSTASRAADGEFTADDGQEIALWRIADPAQVSAIEAALSDQPAYIADGHHRYETSLVYRDAAGGSDDDAACFVLTCMIDFEDPGLLIAPYYRVVHSASPEQLQQLRDLLAKLFVSRSPGAKMGQANALHAVVATVGQSQVALGVVQQGSDPSLLTPANDIVPEPDPTDPPDLQVRSVEAFVLQEMLFRPVFGDAFPQHVAYVHEGGEAMDMVQRGDGQIAFFIKGVPAPTFEAVVGAGIRLPRKSTYFAPKLPSGLVINPLDGKITG